MAMSKPPDKIPEMGADQQVQGIDKVAEPFHKKMSDVSLYSFAGMCAFSLTQLFHDKHNKDFKRKTMEKMLQSLDQPKQTHDSIFEMMNEGETFDNTPAFLEIILEEQCLKDTRQPLIAEIIGIYISDGCYDARLRVLIKHVAWFLRVSWDQVEEVEEELAEMLENQAYVMSEEQEKEKLKKQKKRTVKRYALIGLATIGGGALIGLTGGLAAPLVAAGAGAIIGGAGAAALGSAAGVAIIGSLFGVAGAGLTGYKMKRRIGAVEEFAFEALTLMGSRLQADNSVKQLHLTLVVTGWITDHVPDFRKPWACLAESKEQFSLRWESKYLKQLGEAFEYLLQTGVSVATAEALKYTILSGLVSAVAWPAALISVSGAIDNPWSVCTVRAAETGKQLAEVLLAREQGKRPVTLIGFSLGARVIFYCLEELSKRKGSEGLVEDVILLGAPVSGDPKNWQPFVRVVAGKIVNGYCKSDWMLKFLYRTASIQLRIAGLGPVKLADRRMHNIDLSDLIGGHGEYMTKLDIIMKAVGVRTKDEVKPTISHSHTYAGSSSKSQSNNTGPISYSQSVDSIAGKKSSKTNTTTAKVTGAAAASDVPHVKSAKQSTEAKQGPSEGDSRHISSECAMEGEVTQDDNRTSDSSAAEDSQEMLNKGNSDDIEVRDVTEVRYDADESDIEILTETEDSNTEILKENEADEKTGTESDCVKHIAVSVEDELIQRLISQKKLATEGTTDCFPGLQTAHEYEECEFTDSDPDVDDSK